MVNRGGGMWVSRDGLSTREQVTQGSNYPKVEGRFEVAEFRLNRLRRDLNPWPFTESST
jgi:hypothetical protein